VSDSNEKTTLDVDNITFEPTEDKSTDIADEKIKKVSYNKNVKRFLDYWRG